MAVEDEPQPEERGDKEQASAALIPQLMSLVRAIAASSRRWELASLAAGIVVVVLANAVAQVRLNVWQGAFYDAIEQRNLSAFIGQMVVFAGVVAGLLILVVMQTYLMEMSKVRLREWLTHELLDQWLVPKRAYLVGMAGEIGKNPDQRVHEDARHLSELSADLGAGLMQSTLLLISFVGVLWLLSDKIVFSMGDQLFTIPGYMVWCALAFALSGSLATYFVGRPLIRWNTVRYSREAELRFGMVRISETAEGVALYGGEADERSMLDGSVARVVAISVRLVSGLARLTWITSGYGWLTLAVPIVFAAPGYFRGSMTFGDLMMVVGAFNQVQTALRWFVDNFARIADWRATLIRVVAFRDALLGLDNLRPGTGRIKLADDPAQHLVFDNVSLTLPDGKASLNQAVVDVRPGDHILITGDPGSGKSTLFRAVAGLWPWGTGTIRRPPAAHLMFMPQRPYLPLGSLRAAVIYPAANDRFDDAAVTAALQRVGLERLATSLGREERWDRDLPLDEQQRLAFARILLHAPRYILMDDALMALDAAGREEMLSIFTRELSGAAVVAMSRGLEQDAFFGLKLRVVREVDPSRPPAPKQSATPIRRRSPTAKLAQAGAARNERR